MESEQTFIYTELETIQINNFREMVKLWYIYMLLGLQRDQRSWNMGNVYVYREE